MRKFRNVDQTFNTRFETDECSKLSNTRYRPSSIRANKIFGLDILPRVNGGITIGQSNLAGSYVDLLDFNFNLLAFF